MFCKSLGAELNLHENGPGQGQHQKQDQLDLILQDFLAEISRDRLSKLSKRNDIVVRKLRKGDREDQHPWAYSIVVQWQKRQVVFRCFFSSDGGGDFANLDLKNHAQDLTVDSCHQLFGEFCNLVGGAIKFSFGENFSSFRHSDNNKVKEDLSKFLVEKLGLPEKEYRGKVLRGLLSQHKMSPFVEGKEFIWGLAWENHRVICSAMIQLEKGGWQTLEREVAEQNMTSLPFFAGGEMEFF